MSEQTVDIKSLPLSSSVQNAIGGYPASALVSSWDLASELLTLHTKYAQGLGEKLLGTVGPAKSATRTIEAWFELLFQLFDLDLVKQNVEVLDGRLMIWGLARLDPELKSYLDSAGFLNALEEEYKNLKHIPPSELVRLPASSARKPVRKRTPGKTSQKSPALTPEVPQAQVSLMHGNVEICVAGTSRGWFLPAEGLVIRARSGNQEPGGALYRSMLNSLDLASRQELSDLLKKEILAKGLSTSDPLVVRIAGPLGKKMLPFMSGSQAHLIITPYEISSLDETEEMRTLINGVLVAARRYTLVSLILPILAVGGISTDEQSVYKARQMLNALLATQDFGPLKKITIVTVLPAVIEMARQRFNVYSNNQAQPFSNDEPTGVDLLGISAETDALADTLLLREVRPPLAVGITGGWGSGKSFVIYLLQQRMTQIRTRRISKGWASDPGEGTLSPFVGHIYQIRFNAWTYAKSNLWASLMHTIFFELNRQISLEKTLAEKYAPLDGDKIYAGIYGAVQVDDPGLLEAAHKNMDSNLLWQVMREQKQAELETLRKLEREIAGWKAGREKLNREQLGTIQKELGDQAQYAAAEILKQKAQTLVKQVLDKEGRDLLKANHLDVSQVEEMLASLRSLRAVGRMLWETANKSLLSRALALLLLVFLVGGFIAIPTLARLLQWDNAARLVMQVGVVISALMPVVRIIGNWSQRIKEIVSEYQSAVETEKRNWQATREARIVEKQAADEKNVQKVLTDSTLNLDQKLQQLEKLTQSESNLAAHDHIVEILQARAEDQRKKIGPTARYLTLLEFVRSRIDAAGYEAQLGLLQQVEDDFEELTASLLSVNKRTKEMFPRGEPRIVLFIDDLDRCPPSRVVEVLEAVQLLLKKPIFVVILGLDTRYVTRALEKEYKEILQHEGDPSGLDYIEKIIQIPYRVRPMEPAGLQNYLKAQMDIAIPVPTETPFPVPTEPEKPKRGRKPKPAPAQPAETTPPTNPAGQLNTLLPTPPVERPVELPPEVIKFQSEDLDDLTFCCQQVDLTPRSVKRLVNVFKLIKIFWFRGFGGDQQRPIKQAVMGLLALSAAYPEIMRESFVRLEMWFRNGDMSQKIIFDELAKLSLDEAVKKSFALKWDFFLRDVTAFKAKDFGNISLATLELSTFNLIRSFSFVGDPSYWGEQKPETITRIGG